MPTAELFLRLSSGCFVPGGFHDIPRTSQTTANRPDTTSFTPGRLSQSLITQIITVTDEAVPGEHRTRFHQGGTDISPPDLQTTHETAVHIAGAQIEGTAVTTLDQPVQRSVGLIRPGLLTGARCLQAGEAQGTAITIEFNQKLLSVDDTEHFNRLLRRSGTWKQHGDKGDENGSLQAATRNGEGSLKLLTQESNTSRDDAQRQACIPAASVLPSMNTAPDSNVPTKRPAALAM